MDEKHENNPPKYVELPVVYEHPEGCAPMIRDDGTYALLMHPGAV